MAHAWKRIPTTPRINLLRGEKAREVVLSPEDEQRYLDALPRAMRPLCAFLIDTGLRVARSSEARMASRDLREKPGFIKVRAGHAKRSKSRTVDLTPRARKILETQSGRIGLVFRNASDGPLYHTWLDQQHAEVRTKLAFPAEFVLHSLRHTFGTRLGAAGADVRTIMDLMGHASLAVAQKYVHPSTEAKRRAIERKEEASRVPARVTTSLKVVKARKHASGL